MPSKHKPRSGSLQFWPRKRAKRIYPRSSFSQTLKSDKPFLTFAGYKAGMISLPIKNTNEKSPAKNIIASTPVTVIECPPLKVFGIRFYHYHDQNLTPFSFVSSSKLDKNLQRKISIPKKDKKSANFPEKFDVARLVVYTQPSLTGLGKKKPEIFELSISEKDPEKLKAYLDSEIKVSDVIRVGELVDIKAVTKGKGFHGPVRRFGISLKAAKSEKKKRSAGNLGAWTPTKVSHTVPQAGQMGFHIRTELNKHVLELGESKGVPGPKGGFKRYGIVKNDYILLKGSIPGPSKRLILFSPSRRVPHTKDEFEVVAR